MLRMNSSGQVNATMEFFFFKVIILNYYFASGIFTENVNWIRTFFWWNPLGLYVKIMASANNDTFSSSPVCVPFLSLLLLL